jgi:sporulation protein YlmC with PRC-barrel domain
MQLSFSQSVELAWGASIQGNQEMRTLLLAGTALVAVSSTVWAQSDNSSKQAQNTSNLRSNMTQMLQKSGYTDIRVSPTSFMVQAKDGDGNPVVMSISPDSFTEVTSINPTTASADKNAASRSDAKETFVAVPNGDDLSSKVVGLDIYNNDHKDVGTIRDIALKPNGGAAAYIVSVGGFLGIGDHYVAVSPSAVKVSYNDNDKKWRASMNATADQLKAAPEFKYTGRWNAGRT